MNATAGCCPVCGEWLSSRLGAGRKKTYCSSICKDKARSNCLKEQRRSVVRLLPDAGLYRSCLLCGLLFRTKRTDNLCCSKSCSNVMFRTKAKPECICSQCGKAYVPKKSDRTTFCSRDCAFAHKSKNSEAYAKWNQVRIAVSRVCSVCGRSLNSSRSLRCEDCHKQRARDQAHSLSASRHVVTVRLCKQCGGEFVSEYGSKRRVFCSYHCQIKYDRRVTNAKRRARQRGVAYESIDPIAVFERDGWRCHICGEMTLPFLRGSFEPDAPELDHVVALANGGAHIQGNVACSHRRCNQAKADQ